MFNVQLAKINLQFFAPASPLTWKVRRFRLEEMLGMPYRAQLDLVADGMANTEDLVGSRCSFAVERAGRKRNFNGIVLQYIDCGHGIAGHHSARVQIGPPLTLLSHGQNSKVFQELTAPQVIEKVIKEGLSAFHQQVEVRLQATFAQRECCIQYRESDWGFISRLMDEEGLTLFFEEGEDNDVVVLTDKNEACSLVKTADSLPIPLTNMTCEAGWRECIRNFTGRQSVAASKATVAANDWTKGPLANSRQAESPVDREVYEHALQAIVSSYQGKAYSKSHENDRSRIELERASVLRNVIHGKSNVVTLGVGRFFKVEEQVISGAAKSFVVTRAVHTGVAPEEVESHGSQQGIEEHESYANEFECIPSTIPFRPQKLDRRSLIFGVLTATVVGSPSEEIHTDEHGRIRIQFHWDRDGKHDHTSTCWVRVAQSWAGPGYGTLFIPRIGMEVLVQFVNGDPDQPIVMGCVYNGKNPPPVLLPDNKSQSTIRTESSKGGGGYNELRFEDKKGNEEIFVHAQKDMNEVVENNHNTTVHANQTNTVDGDHTETVHKKQTLTVDKNRKVHIKGSQSVKIDGGQAEDGVTGSKLNITGDYKVDASKTISEQAPNKITFTCQGSSIEMTPQQIKIVAGGKAMIVLNADALMVSKDGSKTKLDGDAELSTAQTAKFVGAKGTVLADSTGVTVSGPNINETGGMGINLSAPLIKIN